MHKLILSLILLSPTAAPCLEFSDPDLRSAISDALGVPALELTEADLANLVDFDPGDRLITDLTGLEHAINLESAVLDDNQLSDLSPLSSLTKLRSLDLHDNRITDLSALEVLNLEDNDITDFSPLTNLPNLTSLILDENQITTIPDLSGLASITNLSIARNAITDVTPVLTIPATANRIVLTNNPIDPNLPGVLAVQLELESRGAVLILTGQRRLLPPVSIALNPTVSAQITISWPSEPGLTYQLNFSDNLSNWQPVISNLDGTGAPLEVSVPLPAAKQGFFQVLAIGVP